MIVKFFRELWELVKGPTDKDIVNLYSPIETAPYPDRFECSNCKFSISHGAAVLCRRFPNNVEKQQRDWCGEHELKIVHFLRSENADQTGK